VEGSFRHATGNMPGGDRGLLSVPDWSDRFRANIDVTVGLAERLGCQVLSNAFGRTSRVAITGRRATQARVMAASQARAPVGLKVMSILAGSIESTCHPSSKLALISSWVIRRGPKAPGWRSLKHSMK